MYMYIHVHAAHCIQDHRYLDNRAPVITRSSDHLRGNVRVPGDGIAVNTGVGISHLQCAWQPHHTCTVYVYTCAVYVLYVNIHHVMLCTVHCM